MTFMCTHKNPTHILHTLYSTPKHTRHKIFLGRHHLTLSINFLLLLLLLPLNFWVNILCMQIYLKRSCGICQIKFSNYVIISFFLILLIYSQIKNFNYPSLQNFFVASVVCMYQRCKLNFIAIKKNVVYSQFRNIYFSLKPLIKKGHFHPVKPPFVVEIWWFFIVHPISVYKIPLVFRGSRYFFNFRHTYCQNSLKSRWILKSCGSCTNFYLLIFSLKKKIDSRKNRKQKNSKIGFWVVNFITVFKNL